MINIQNLLYPIRLAGRCFKRVFAENPQKKTHVVLAVDLCETIEKADLYMVNTPPKAAKLGSSSRGYCLSLLELESVVSRLYSEGHTQLSITSYNISDKHMIFTELSVTAKKINDLSGYNGD